MPDEPTFLYEKTRLALLIPDRKRLDYTVDLLRLAWQGHLHETTQRYIKRVMGEIESFHVQSQCLCQEGFAATSHQRCSQQTPSATHFAARTFAISLRPMVPSTFSSHFSGVSSSSRATACFMALLLITAVMLPVLGRGLAPRLIIPDAVSSDMAKGRATPVAITSLDRAGKGNSEAPFGDVGPEPKSPLEIRCMTLGRRGGEPASNEINPGVEDGRELCGEGPCEIVDARGRVARVGVCFTGGFRAPPSMEEETDADVDVRDDWSCVSFRKIRRSPPKPRRDV